MFPLIAMLVFVLIALLGLFHVLIVKATAWGFVAWFVALVVHNVTRKDKAEPNLENTDTSGKAKEKSVDSPEYVSPPPQGGDATIPVARPSDASYEAVVSYPMEMEQEL